MSRLDEHPPPPVPERPSLRNLREAIDGCRACELYAHATRPVMGEGRAGARLMLVGEQPGDREDREGHPFVGPAGRVLDEALERAGIDRRDAYVSNVVKHFRFTLRGRRRIHQTPERVHVAACRPWLDAELAVVKPQALVLLGATAARAILGSQIRIGRDRGRPQPCDLAELVTLTTHPSAILRAEDEDRAAAMDELVADLHGVGTWMAEHRGS
ncbi:MAG TPA: UdgX family uracil-DNA binding protein [Solirubrobacteraceae bacterium]|nr:UdgX family uracil-DNA binding protein [Solirubrobacteraceae bacterium]